MFKDVLIPTEGICEIPRSVYISKQYELNLIFFKNWSMKDDCSQLIDRRKGQIYSFLR